MTDPIQRRYELILNSAGEGIYGLDHQGRGTFVNPAAVVMTGWTAEDIIGQKVHQLHHHSRADGSPYPQQQCPIYAALNDGEIHQISNEVFWRKDGSSFPVLYTSTPIWEDGQVIGAVVIFQDITDKKKAEAELVALQRSNELLLSAAGEGICGFDRQGKVTFANPAAATMLGRSNQEVTGLTIQQILDTGEQTTSDICPVQMIVNGGGSYRQDDRVFMRKDGSSFPVDFVSTAIMENDQLQGVVVVFSDITERKLAQSKLKNALAEIQCLKNRLEAENIYLQEEINLNHNFADILGQSPALKKVLHQVEQVAPNDTSVLILGETGTGKELFARSLHNLSSRKHRALVKVNCAALPSNLIESELFGHEKGSFTGATARRIGRFELAHEGTIFLDEIGELPLDLQTKLLRVLQEGEIERLGNSNTISINVRVIAATHRNLKAMVVAGEFREDLYYRLSVFPIKVPALRERKNDISILVQWFVKKYSTKIAKQIDSIPQPVMTKLSAYAWPGNVRELENVIERAVILTPDNTFSIPDLLDNLNSATDSATELVSLAELEKQHIIKVLEQTHWKISGETGAASVLELHPNTLRSRMNKLGIKRSNTVLE